MTTPQMCNAQSGPQEPHIYSKAKKPRSLTDLLENIKLLVEQTLLDRDDFYSEENIRNFFGGDTLEWSDQDGEKKFRILMEFTTIVEPFACSGAVCPAAELRITRWTEPSGARSTILLLSFGRPRSLDFEGLVRTFGPTWIDAERVPTGHEIYVAPTRPHGNAYIEYNFDRSKLHTQVLAAFYPDASLGDLEVIVEQSESFLSRTK